MLKHDFVAALEGFSGLAAKEAGMFDRIKTKLIDFRAGPLDEGLMLVIKIAKAYLDRKVTEREAEEIALAAERFARALRTADKEEA